MFVIYDGEGEIDHTVIGPDRAYGELLDSRGCNWLFVEGATQVDIRLVRVDVAAKELRAKDPIALAASKTTIAADGIDAAVITGIPAGAIVQVFCNEQLQATEIVADGTLELTAAAPASYRIACFRKCFLPAELTIVAT